MFAASAGEPVGQAGAEIDRAHAAVGASGQEDLVRVDGQGFQGRRQHAVDDRLDVLVPPFAVGLGHEQDEMGQGPGGAQAVVDGLEGQIAAAVAHAQVDDHGIGLGRIVVLGQGDVIGVAIIRRLAGEVVPVAAAHGVVGRLEKPEQVAQGFLVLLEEVGELAALVQPVLEDPEHELFVRRQDVGAVVEIIRRPTGDIRIRVADLGDERTGVAAELGEGLGRVEADDRIAGVEIAHHVQPVGDAPPGAVGRGQVLLLDVGSVEEALDDPGPAGQPGIGDRPQDQGPVDHRDPCPSCARRLSGHPAGRTEACSRRARPRLRSRRHIRTGPARPGRGRRP